MAYDTTSEPPEPSQDPLAEADRRPETLLDLPEGNISLSATFLVVAAISPFVNAFAAKLGERLGERVHLRRRAPEEVRSAPNELVLTHRQPSTTITIEFPQDTSEEAWRALLDLDVQDPAWRGQRLRWSEADHAWLPAPPPS